MKSVQIPIEEPNGNVRQEVTRQDTFHGADNKDTKAFSKELSPHFEDAFQPYDPKKHHPDARYISEVFQEYYSGKEQIALEVPLNLPVITDHDVKNRDFYHPVMGRNVLSPRGFTVHRGPSKQAELPLMPPDRLLAQASERHLNSVSLNPFLAKQLSPHQSIGQFVSLSDGTLHTYPLIPQKMSLKHRRSSASFSSGRSPNTAHARNIASPSGLFADPIIRGTSIQSRPTHKKYDSITSHNTPAHPRRAQEIHMKLFPVVDNRTSTPGKRCRSESVPIITAMVTNENLFSQSTQPLFGQSKSFNSSPKPSILPIQRRPSSTYIVGSFPGRMVGEKRPLTTTASPTRTISVRQGSPSFKCQASVATESAYLGCRPRRSAPTAVKRPTVRSSLGAWALDQSPPEEILEKVNREHALPPRHINFNCKKTVPLYRAHSTG